MEKIYGYGITVYGGEQGVNDCRAKIVLWPERVDQQVERTPLGAIRFYDPGMGMPQDGESGRGEILMHLPTRFLRNVIDILRNEEPVYINYHNQTAWLITSEEPVGEGE
jgi:hypothetical protein